jgi:hypothetical protein
MAFDVATGGPERRKEERKRRQAVPGNEWNPCLRACEFATEAAKEAHYEEVRQRKRRAESEEFQAEFNNFMDALEEAEQQPDDAPFRDRIETIEDVAEFDAFLRSLEEAEEQSND